MDAGRPAGLALSALLLFLLLPATGQADDPRPGERTVLGSQHTRQHADIWKAQASARSRWRKMTPSQRRRARRRIERETFRSYVRARAAATGPASEGTWDLPFVMTENYEGYAIHAAMLRTGKVLMWGYPIHTDTPAFRGNESYAWLWDVSKGYSSASIKRVEPIGADGKNVSIYCSGMSFLPDGRVLVVGGNLAWPDEKPDDEYTEFVGLDKALLFDPVTEEWTELPRPALEPGVFNGRWYPSQVLMPDGRTFVISGLTDEPPGGEVNDMHELYEPPSGAYPLGRFTLLDTVAQRRDTELYPHLFVMPDGNILLAGPNIPSAPNGTNDSAIFDPQNLATPWTELPSLNSQRIGSTAVLLPDGPEGSSEVMLVGGRPYDTATETGIPPAYDELIDLDDPSPSWTRVPGLETPRSYPNTVILPDESLVTIGGDSRVVEKDSGGEDIWPPPERHVEIYDPTTSSWRVGPAQTEARQYHSTALLLPDGRVLSTGDDFNPVTREPWDRSTSSPNDTGEIYSPPYLFDVDGDRIPAAARPQIVSAPEAVRWNEPFAVGTGDDIDRAVLVAPSAVTHANDMNQRLVPLEIVGRYPSDGVTVQSPPSANVAPPGWYMLFLVENSAGAAAGVVVSEASWVRLDGAAPDAPIQPPDLDPPPDPEPGPDPEPAPTPDTQPDPTSDPQPEPDPDSFVEEPEGLADFAGPTLRLKFAERRWLKQLRRRGRLRVLVRVDEPAKVALKLYRGKRRIARKRTKILDGRKKVAVRPRRGARRWLRRTRRPRVRLSVKAVDAARNDTRWSRVLKPALRR